MLGQRRRRWEQHQPNIGSMFNKVNAVLQSQKAVSAYSDSKQTQDSKLEPWRSEAELATSRSRRFPSSR